MGDMGVLEHGAPFIQAASVAHDLVCNKVANGTKRGVLLRSSCDSDSRQMMFLSMQSCRCTGPAHQG